MIKFTIQSVFRKKYVAILSAVGIGFGLMLMFVLGAFNAGTQASLDENFSRVQGIVDITEAEQQGANSQIPIDVPEKLIKSEIGENIISYNVEAELPQIYSTYYRAQKLLKNEQDGLSIIGVDLSRDSIWGGITTKIIDGRNIEPGAYEVLIDSRIYNAPEEFGFNSAIGDKLTLYLDYPILDTNKIELTIVGVYEQQDNGAPDFVPRTYYAYTDIDTAWKINELGWEEPYDYFNYYTKVSVRFPASSDSEQTTKYVEELEAFDTLGVRIDAFSLAQFQESISDSIGIFNTFLTIVSVISGLAGGMAIIVAQLNNVSQRIKEFAILKATGWKNSHIFKDILFESLTIGALGAIIGLGLGFGIIALFESGVGPFSGIEAIITVELIAQILFFALGIGAIAGFYPGIKAARIRPVAVLKGE